VNTLQPAVDEHQVGVGDARGRERRDREVERVHDVPALAQREGERPRDQQEQPRAGHGEEVLLADRVAKRGGDPPQHQQR
jgi:hypothetical protein